MCGIFGMVAAEAAGWRDRDFQRLMTSLFKLSESRGKEAAGIAVLQGETIAVYKEPVAASDFIRTGKFESLFRPNGFVRSPLSVGRAIIGHSRLVTNGSQVVDHNNQPVRKDGMVCIHNGIIVNDEELWRRYPSLRRRYEVDTEVYLSLVAMFRRQGRTTAQSICGAYALIEGATTTATLVEDLDCLFLSTNNGSLYLARGDRIASLFFASERYILEQFLRTAPVGGGNHGLAVEQVAPNTGVRIALRDLALFRFDLRAPPADDVEMTRPARRIVPVPCDCQPAPVTMGPATIGPVSSERLLSVDEAAIGALKRCTACLLPETFPFIEFDERGVCSLCNSHRKLSVKGPTALEAAVAPFRRSDGRADCVVAFSGGRDSSYTLHYVKNVLKMNPIAFSYDWGMLTDLGRRNQSRMTGSLGIEHVLVSADITRKRSNIRKNVEAWLRRPALGTIPLFMAGDKQYFYYVDKVKKRNGLTLVIMGENHLEKTGFKNGFAGVRQQAGGSMAYHVSTAGKIAMLSYYARECLRNPAYLNASMLDTVGAFLSYFVMPHRYLNIFDYIPWNEQQVAGTLVEAYDWELATDTTTTWRIGDGTAAFYNYIYYVVAGFSEIDTFRSNQIREGVLTRDQARDLARRENIPRFESIKWYCDTIGVDLHRALTVINGIPKLYRVT